MQALWIAKTGLDAQQTKLSNISNNLANAGTTGFKASRAVFEDLVYQNMRQAGAQSSQDSQLSSGLMIGTGVRVSATEKLFSQGNLAQTDNSLDVAIQGRGFFEVVLPDGSSAYTRDGSFQLDSTGQIVTPSGYALQPTVTVPNNALSISIGTDGTISAVLPGASTSTQIGTLQMADFVNAPGLQPIGQNLYLETSSSGTPQTGNPGLNGLGTVTQGFVESSNVNVVEELVNMIETQRSYEMSSRAIATADQMLQYVSNNL